MQAAGSFEKSIAYRRILGIASQYTAILTSSTSTEILENLCDYSTC
jgi:hypothetical protein